MAISDQLSEFIAAVPKVELHVHLVGSASPAVVSELAAKYPDAGVPAGDLSEWFAFRDFPHFIDVYTQVSSLVRSGEDIATIVGGYATEAARQNISYVEMTVTPETQVKAGIPYADVVDGLNVGRSEAAKLGVEFAWVYDISGELGQPSAEATVDLVMNHAAPDGLVGFGLGGFETITKWADFGWAFDAARSIGLHSVPHAGEANGPDTVVAALDALGAERIGHGIRSIEDPNLMKRLVDEQVPLEVCPSSNVCTGVFPSLDAHSLPALLAAGAFVTINSDDPPMFSTTLTDEYLRIADTFDLSAGTITSLIGNGISASFLPDAAKRTLLDELERAVD